MCRVYVTQYTSCPHADQQPVRCNPVYLGKGPCKGQTQPSVDVIVGRCDQCFAREVAGFNARIGASCQNTQKLEAEIAEYRERNTPPVTIAPRFRREEYPRVHVEKRERSRRVRYVDVW